MKRVFVLGSNYSLLSREACHSLLLNQAKEGKGGYVCVSNVHTTMMGYFDSEYQKITNESLLSVPDGLPLVWAMNSMSEGGQDRIRGPSLMRDLVDKGRALKLKHFLFGGSPTALKSLKEKLESEYPGAEIVGEESPPFKPFEKIALEELKSQAERINSTGAHFVWVGLGAPKQELWMYAQRNSINGVMLGVGAAFDLLSGRIPEAPALMQSLGLEWLYRFWQEPGRLWKRYVFNNPAFLMLWTAQFISQKFTAKR